jgi:hypothetical protein
MKKARIATFLIALGAATFFTMSASWAQEPASGVKPAHYISEFQVTDPEGISHTATRWNQHSSRSGDVSLSGVEEMSSRSKAGV